MADVDAAQILFYASPLLWAERLMTGWRRESGFPLSRMLAEGAGSPVVRVEISYRQPLRLDDEVEGTLWFGGRSARSFTLLSHFTGPAGGPIAVEVAVKQVTVRHSADGSLTAVEVPAAIAARLESLEGKGPSR